MRRPGLLVEKEEEKKLVGGDDAKHGIDLVSGLRS